MKRSRPIDFTLLIEIEGITNMNDEGINIKQKRNGDNLSYLCFNIN